MEKIDIKDLEFWHLMGDSRLVEIYEKNYNDKISHLCEEFLQSNSRVILLCGPSSSGKTTTATRLQENLTKSGKTVHVISLDDFFMGNEHVPLWSDGQKNFESIECIDLELLESTLKTLCDEGKATFPVFDFIKHVRSNKTFELEIDENTILIIEGIHALNPIVASHIKELSVYKVYVSVHSDFYYDGKLVLSGRDLRLMRRTLRDSVHRSMTAPETFHLWKYVLKGEEEYMHPYRGTADFHINSTHGYEPLLYRDRMEKILIDGEKDDVFKELCQRLLSSIEYFNSLDDESLPDNSLIQEFNR